MFDEDKSGKIDEDEFFFLLQYLGIEVGVPIDCPVTVSLVVFFRFCSTADSRKFKGCRSMPSFILLLELRPPQGRRIP